VRCERDAVARRYLRQFLVIQRLQRRRGLRQSAAQQQWE
jgi:hypothetical protein